MVTSMAVNLIVVWVSITLMKGGNMTGNKLMQEPVDAVERLIKYLVAIVERSHSLRLNFSRVVVDFIKDKDGNTFKLLDAEDILGTYA